MAAKRYELTDTQWEWIKDMIPKVKTGRTPKDDRMMINAMFRLARSEVDCAGISERYCPHQTVYSSFDDGTFLRIFRHWMRMQI